MAEPKLRKRTVFLIVYLVFAILPVYWMVNMSFKTNEEILAAFSLWPQQKPRLARTQLLIPTRMATPPATRCGAAFTPRVMSPMDSNKTKNTPPARVTLIPATARNSTFPRP